MQIEQARRRFERSPYARLLGVRIEALEHERAVVRLPHDLEHDNGNGSLNGGATASLINMAGALAAWTGIDLEAADRLACVDLNIQYLSAAFGDDVLAKARVLRRGRDLFFLDVHVSTDDGRPICQGMMIYRSPAYGDHPPRLFDGFTPRTPPESHMEWPEPGMLRGFGEKLDMSPGDIAPGYASLHLGDPESNTDGHGHLHEGAVASLVDFVGTVTAWSLVKDWRNVRGATVGIQVAFARQATGPVVAHGFLEHRSEEAFLSTVAVTDGANGELICAGQVSYRLLEAR
jgi:uncharacterized protein (TIGR00369 family)